MDGSFQGARYQQVYTGSSYAQPARGLDEVRHTSPKALYLPKESSLSSHPSITMSSSHDGASSSVYHSNQHAWPTTISAAPIRQRDVDEEQARPKTAPVKEVPSSSERVTVKASVHHQEVTEELAGSSVGKPRTAFLNSSMAKTEETLESSSDAPRAFLGDAWSVDSSRENTIRGMGGKQVLADDDGEMFHYQGQDEEESAGEEVIPKVATDPVIHVPDVAADTHLLTTTTPDHDDHVYQPEIQNKLFEIARNDIPAASQYEPKYGQDEAVKGLTSKAYNAPAECPPSGDDITDWGIDAPPKRKISSPKKPHGGIYQAYRGQPAEMDMLQQQQQHQQQYSARRNHSHSPTSITTHDDRGDVVLIL